MNRFCINHRSEAHRRGSLMPAIAFALLVVGGVAALVLNRLWIDAAEVELRNAAEAAALSAAREYLGDHLLLSQVDYQLIAEQAKRRAAQLSLSNRVAGQPVNINLDENGNGDIYFGYNYYDAETGESTFLESNSKAAGVLVRTYKSRQLGNPINLFFAGVTDQPEADALVYAEVSFDNVIDHFRPTRFLPVPAFPLAILADDVSGQRTDTWDAQITQKQGADLYGFDSQSNTVIEGADGIPEMVLRSVPLNTDPLLANVQLLDFNNGLNEQKISKQIRDGLSSVDLEMLNGIIPAQNLLSISGSANITTPVQQALGLQAGQQRLCLLYTKQLPTTIPGWSNLECQGVVAIRILRVIPESGESATIIVQPTVMTTKTATLARYLQVNNSTGQETSTPIEFYRINPYVYKMFVSR